MAALVAAGSRPDAGTIPVSGRIQLEHCDTEGAANEHVDCRAAATVISVDDVWSKSTEQANIDYRQPGMHIFKGDVTTGCGHTSATGPFYCPRDETAYLDVTFFDELHKLGGSSGPLAQMYATAHEMGHHIQQLEGTLGLSDYKNPGEDSAAVAIELQADCYAGLWAHYAEQDGALEPITQQQLDDAIQTAQAIGDDNIQRRSGGEVDPDAWTHGSSEQRGQASSAGIKAAKCLPATRSAGLQRLMVAEVAPGVRFLAAFNDIEAFLRSELRRKSTPS